MKSGTTNSIPMIATTSDDLSDPNNLKAIHSIEAILGIKNVDNHHSYLPLPLQLHQQNKKRNLNEHYPDSKNLIIKKYFFERFLFR
jgi:hypothetical protein